MRIDVEVRDLDVPPIPMVTPPVQAVTTAA